MKLLICSGSYNPYHKAHNMVMKLAEAFVDDGSYRHIVEISKSHPTKGEIGRVQFQNRLIDLADNVSDRWAIYPSTNATFKDKSDYFCNKFFDVIQEIVFVIGGDVWEQYSDDLIADFENYEKCEVFFLVICRDGNLNLPNMDSSILHYNSFGCIPPVHNGISSTKIRKNKQDKYV